jgi:hypothetical protein
VLFQLKPQINDPADRLSNSLATLAVHRRTAILEAIAVSARELLRCPDLDTSLPRVVECVGPAVEADHLSIVLKDGDLRPCERGCICTHYTRNASGRYLPEVSVTRGRLVTDEGFALWMPILAGGNVIVGKTEDFDSDARRHLQLDGIRSVLRIPIFAEDEWRGFIGFDFCRSERDWHPTEIEIVKILAELVGSAIVSFRRLQVLELANRVVETSPTILYRLGPQPPFPLVFVSKNINRYGYDAEELLAAPDKWPQLIHQDDIAITVGHLTELAEGKRDFSLRGNSTDKTGRLIKLV